ncbi:MAG: FtsX-like permease family protein, partial [Oscillospiraceae bacterium]|nr:FtsX-like permease family protein [Oscillospiraceae bacterium]
VVGIALSAAMFTDVAAMVSSALAYEANYEIYTQGYWHVAFYDLTQEQAEQLSTDERTELVSRITSLGYAESDGEEYQLCAVNQTYLENMPVYLTQGRLPETGGEVLIPESLLERWQVGDTLELEGLGSCTVVGVYGEDYCGQLGIESYDLLTLGEAGETGNHLYVAVKKTSQVNAFGADWGDALLCTMGYHTALLAVSGSFQNQGYAATFWQLGGILVGIILIGSVSLIYNAFSISLSERTRQFGILSSVGATRRQLNRSVLWEALFVGGVGIPLGILAGLGGIGLTLFLLRGRFETMLSLSQDLVAFDLQFNWFTIVLALLVSAVTVLLSAWLPARRATRMTAIQAIRQSGDIKLRKRDVRVIPLTGKIFGLEGLLASKNFKRNRKRYRATVLSLAVSVLLLLSAWTYTGAMSKSVSAGNADYDVYATDYSSDLDEGESLSERVAQVEQEIARLDTVESSQLYGRLMWVNVRLEDLSLAIETPSIIHADDGTVCVNTQVYGVPDEEFSAYLTELGIDPEPYFTSEAPMAVLCGQWNGTLDGTYTVTSALNESPEEVTIYASSRQDNSNVTISLTVGDTVKEGWPNTASATVCTLYLPMSQWLELAEDLCAGVLLYCQAEDHQAATEDIRNLELGLSVQDVAESDAAMRNVVFIIQIFCGGFIALMALISVANVFNTISTSIALRRRELAMLRSVGLTGGGLGRMMCYECLLYGAKALLYGLPLGWLVALLMLKAISSSYQGPAYWPILPSVVCIIGVFLSVAISTLYAVRKLRKENLIDALKNENM